MRRSARMAAGGSAGRAEGQKLVRGANACNAKPPSASGPRFLSDPRRERPGGARGRRHGTAGITSGFPTIWFRNADCYFGGCRCRVTGWCRSGRVRWAHAARLFRGVIPLFTPT